MSDDRCSFCETFNFNTVKIILPGNADEEPKIELGDQYDLDQQMKFCPYCGLELSTSIQSNKAQYTLYSYYLGLTRKLAVCLTEDFQRMKKSDKLELGDFDIYERDEQGNFIVEKIDEQGKEIYKKLDNETILVNINKLIDQYQTPKEE